MHCAKYMLNAESMLCVGLSLNCWFLSDHEVLFCYIHIVFIETSDVTQLKYSAVHNIRYTILQHQKPEHNGHVRWVPCHCGTASPQVVDVR
jgi:hypothetical protein